MESNNNPYNDILAPAEWIIAHAEELQKMQEKMKKARAIISKKLIERREHYFIHNGKRFTLKNLPNSNICTVWAMNPKRPLPDFKFPEVKNKQDEEW